MMTLEELFTAPFSPMKASELSRKINDSLHEVADNPHLSLNEVAVIAAAEGIISATVKRLVRAEAEPAAAGQPDTLTSLDV